MDAAFDELQFIGIDPGGRAAMGWCVLTVNDAGLWMKSGTCTGIDSCLHSLIGHIAGQPAAVGIDAPLYWTRSGDRVADRRIRKAITAFGGNAGTVSHVNSLRGACLVQGVLAAVAVMQRWPCVKLTESHPKALIRIWPQALELLAHHTFINDHERDAALGALAARAFYDRKSGWVDWSLREVDPYFPTGDRVAYWFPECL